MPKEDPRIRYLKRLFDRKRALEEIDSEGDNEGYEENILDQPEDLETRPIPQFGDEEIGPALPVARYGPRYRNRRKSGALQQDLSQVDVRPPKTVVATRAATEQKLSARPVQAGTEATAGVALGTPTAAKQETSDRPFKFKRRAVPKHEASARPVEAGTEITAGAAIGTPTAVKQESSEANPSVN